MHPNRPLSIPPAQPLTRRAVLGKAAVAALAAATIGVGPTRNANAQRAGERARATQETAVRDGASWVDRVLVMIPAGGVVVLGEERYVNGAFRWVTYNGVSGWAWANHLVPISGPGEDQPPPAGGPLGGIGRTTAALNLREGAGTNYRVLLVIPAGARVTFGDQIANGFRNVTYSGSSGWAFDQYIDKSGGTPQEPQHPAPGAAGRTSVALNLREQPSTSGRVFLVMPAGATVSYTNQVVNGFRVVTYNGLTGWAFDQYITKSGGDPGGPGPVFKRTTVALNLREQPSTSARVLLVMPAGVTVQVGDQANNGFRLVSYNGTSGWAFESYLA